MTLFNKRRARLLVPGFHPDPSVCSDRPGHLVLAFSSFEYFPGLPVWESADGGRTWSFCSHAASRPDRFTVASLGNSQGFYAPTIRWHEGTYYLIVTDVNRGAMIFTTADPHGPWVGPVMVEGWPGIDPSLLFDEDGTCYICGNEAGSGEKPGIYAAPINPDTGRVLGPRHFLIGGITGANPEGPHLYRREGRYYLMWAEGGTEAGHMECLARADSVFGPYEPDPHNPILTNRSTHLSPQCIGHADFAPLGKNSLSAGTPDDGGLDTRNCDAEEDFLVFLGLRTNADYPQQGWLGRENFGAVLRWKDGWPELADQSFFVDPDDSGCALPYANPADEWICPGVDRDGLFHVTADGDTDRKVTGVSPASAMQTGVPSNNLCGSQPVMVDLAPLARKTDLSAEFDSIAGPRLVGRRQTSMDDGLTAVIPSAQLLTGVSAGLIVYASHDVWADVRLDRTSERDGRVTCRLFDKGVLATLANLPVNLEPPSGGTADGKVTGVTSGTDPVNLSPDAVTLSVRGDDHGYSFFATLPAHNGTHNGTRDGRKEADAARPAGQSQVFLGRVPCEPFASTHAGGFTGTLLGVYARTDEKGGQAEPIRLLCR